MHFCSSHTVHRQTVSMGRPGSLVGIAIGYRLDGPGIESRWGRDFPPVQTGPGGPPSLLYNEYLVFPGGEDRPGRDAEPASLLAPRSRKSRALPLLPLWAVRPVQSLSACTRVLFLLFQWLWLSYTGFTYTIYTLFVFPIFL